MSELVFLPDLIYYLINSSVVLPKSRKSNSGSWNRTLEG